MRFLVTLWLLCAAVLCQTVRLANHSTVPFVGWKRTTVDRKPPFAAGELPRATYVLGRAIGDGTTWAVDLRVTLKPGELLVLDLADAKEQDYQVPPIPRDIMRWFGGPLALNGKPLEWVDLRVDGAAYRSHLRVRSGRMLCTNVWLTHYAGEPWAHGEVIVTASNPAVPDMGEAVPELRLTFGDGLVWQPGRGVGQPLLPIGTRLADGQGKYLPLTVVWTRHLRHARDWASVGAVAELGIGACGIADLWPTGTPPTPRGFDARAWADQRFGEAVRRLYTWDPPVVGPALLSGVTGAQEDQFYHPGTEALLQPGAEWVRLLSACKLHAERPCNHLEADGSPLEIDRHDGVLFWDARPYKPITSTMLGKPRALTPEEAHGRWGPDTQHWLTRSLSRSTRLTDSQAGQWLLRNLTTAYLAQRTADPRLSTSGTWSAREWGYEPLFVAETVAPLLDDRALAARAVARWRERATTLLLPRLEGRDYLHTYRDDPRLGAGEWVSAWMECIAAWGIDLACERLGPEEGRAAALRIADRMMADAWVQQGGQWLTRPTFPLEGDMPPPDGSFNAFAMPLAVAVVLRHRPDDRRARAVWEQLLEANDLRWMPALAEERTR